MTDDRLQMTDRGPAPLISVRRTLGTGFGVLSNLSSVICHLSFVISAVIAKLASGGPGRGCQTSAKDDDDPRDVDPEQ